MNSLDILTTDIPLAERMMYLALDTRFLRDHFAMQLQQARDHVAILATEIKSEVLQTTRMVLSSEGDSGLNPV